MGEAQQVGTQKPTHAGQNILVPIEINSGFVVVGRYVNDYDTPVPNFCFIRHGYIIQGETKMSTKHNHMIIQLNNLIQKHLYSNGVEHAHNYIFSTNRLNTNTSSEAVNREETLPDLAIYLDPIKGDKGSIPTGQIPILVIEVLSRSTALNDITEKRTKYRDMGVKNYWVIVKSEDRNEGLEQSLFFVLKGVKYFEISPDFQESGILLCSDLYDLHISAEDVWYKEDSKNSIFRWYDAELRADQEKDRADQEKDRADQEKDRANQENDRANQEKDRANQEKDRADQLEEKLKKLIENSK